MARPLRLEPLFETIFREVARVMPVEAFVITLYEPEKEALHAAFIVDKGQRYAPVTLPADRGPTVEVVRTGRPLFINRRPEEMDRPVPGRRLVGVPEEPASAIIVPMILESRVVGTISARSRALAWSRMARSGPTRFVSSRERRWPSQPRQYLGDPSARYAATKGSRVGHHG